MITLINKLYFRKLALLIFISAAALTASASTKVTDFRKINQNTVEIRLSDNKTLTIDFYGDNIFRLFCDPAGGEIRDPEAKPEAKILVEQPRKAVATLNLSEKNNLLLIKTAKIRVEIDKTTSLLKVYNIKNNSLAFEEIEPLAFDSDKVTLALNADSEEFFYGGGVQNGRFSHRGKIISIENQNSWTDGGVASPAPFYWSTNGYALMWHTFRKGKYDFGASGKNKVKIAHETSYLDVFVMINDRPTALLNDYYQLTGNPVLLPKFGFYEGHLNAYNRDYWKADTTGILFEDGLRYRESQKDSTGIKESLNGEKNNYQFSARAVIDRYRNHDMPLGWILPNDGYGAGYGQTETLDGNIQNLKSLGDYARSKGVEIGLWTQSDLHPKDGVSALLQRDIIKEVRDAGVRVLKTDVAWVGAGYSFGLNGIADVAQIMTKYGSGSRPFIISLDGWAGTQRYAGIWSGDQTGGVWEYIRFHIPTYIGSGLSGIPNITSDMDGIFGGKNQTVNIRDFQWKTFTPMQLNMDGWGTNEKYPHALGEPAASINRWYLKLKSMLVPYTYSIAKEAVSGYPIIRAMFLEYPNDYTRGTATQYQFMYGKDFLVAPVYQSTKADEQGNDVRNGIYLPEGSWFDWFTGERYEGGRIINDYPAPIWKLPVFVREGAIIPLANPNNNVSEIDRSHRIYEFYPSGKSSFTEYDDDGISEAYKTGKFSETLITSSLDAKGNVRITVNPAKGGFSGFVKNRSTEFRINAGKRPAAVSAKIGKTTVKLKEAASKAEFQNGENLFFFDEKPELNRFATPGSEFAKVSIVKNPMILVKLASTDITANAISLTVNGFELKSEDKHLVKTGKLAAPANFRIGEKDAAAYTLKPAWDAVANADYYEIEFQGMSYSTIRSTELLFEGLTPETGYSFKLRAVNCDGVSDWTSLSAKTLANPLEFAIRGIAGECSVRNQRGEGLNRLFNFDETDMWHTRYDTIATPFEIIIDLKSFNQLDKLDYLPRTGGVNGIFLTGSVSYSFDRENWTKAGDFDWKRNSETKTFVFEGKPQAKYVKISVSSAAGNFGSGREIYVFRVPGTNSYIYGDVNNDGIIDEKDAEYFQNMNK
ncbi:MAG: DUF5110 domain-containing protein [Dysgonamonadaceae bacterium]|jgi:alpha-glucosidase (family GH31 glycosyl hydrolase)|nr:DUF5110 domain-containing protein [Dysgonamonadaceae bacterium]